MPGHVAVNMMPNVSMKTIYEWYQVCRDVTESKLRENPIIFGSSVINTSVQIDETLFGKQQKYYKGKYTNQKWLFGMVDQEKYVCFVTPVEKTDESTLLTIIKSRVEHPENLEIVLDGWNSYKNLPESGFSHYVVIHKVEFVNEDGRHTNSV